MLRAGPPDYGILLSLLVQYLLIGQVAAVTCFGINGLAYENNTICPGSNACCNSLAGCQSNRLCHNEGQNAETFIRGPCAVDPYDPESCATICLYTETTGFLPRVTVCADGSLCCDASPNCCEAKQGVFLDQEGNIIPTLMSSTSVSSTVAPTSTTISDNRPASLTSSLTSQQNTSPAAASHASNSNPESATQGAAQTAQPTHSSHSLSSGIKIGLGIGIPLVIIAFSCFLALVWYQRRRLKLAEGAGAKSRLQETNNHASLQEEMFAVPLPPKVVDAVPMELPAESEPRPAELPVPG